MDPLKIANQIPTSQIACLITKDCITLCAMGKPVMVRVDDQQRYAQTLAFIRENRMQDAWLTANHEIPLWKISARSIVIEGVEVEITQDNLLINKKEQPPETLEYIHNLSLAGLSIDSILNFLGRLENNPSFKARKNLLDWLMARQLPITEDGHFLAYKAVKDDLWDHHTGNTFHHLEGAEILMPRRDVDDDPHNSCSSGAHFADFNYMRSYRESVICVLKIDPADVVVITHSEHKGRACRYVVVGHFKMNMGGDGQQLVEGSYPNAPTEFPSFVPHDPRAD